MKNNTTPASFRIISGIMLLANLLIFSACSKNDDLPANPGNPAVNKVQFSKDQYQASENSPGMFIDIDLQSRANSPGRISVKLQSPNAVYGTDYTTQPEAVNGNIMIPVQEGSQKVSVKVIPVNNNVRNSSKEITLTLNQEGSSYKPEGIILSKVEITDDETFITASFRETQAAIMENAATGYPVELLLEPAATEEGFVEIDLTSTNAVYGQHYTTFPAAPNGKIRLPVQTGNTTVSFVIYGKDNFQVNMLRKITLTIGSVSDNIQVGNIKTMNFFIEDNDDNTGRSIAYIRDIFTGNAYAFNTPTRITGVVTSHNDNLDARVMYIEDATGGIAIRFPNRHSFNAGDAVNIELNGSVLLETNGILNISQINNGAATRIGFQTKHIPASTPSALYHSPAILEGRIITLENVRFLNADGVTQLRGDQRITDGGRQVIVRTENFASFASRVIPSGNVSVTGILVWRNNEYTIYPQKSNDIR